MGKLIIIIVYKINILKIKKKRYNKRNIKDIFTKSLNTKLIALFLIISLLPLAIIGYMNYTTAKTALTEDAYSKLNLLVEEKEIQLQTLLETQIANTRYLAQDHEVMRLSKIMVNFDGTSTKAAQQAAQVELKEMLIEFGDFYGGDGLSGGTYADIMVGDLTGYMWVATYGPDEGGNEAGTDWFQQGKDNLCLGPIEYNPVMKQTTQMAAVPIRDKYGSQEVIAVLQLETNIRIIDEIMDISQENETESEELYILNEDKLFLTHSRFDSNAQGKQIVDTKGVNQVLSTKEDTTLEHADYRGVPVLASIHFFGDSMGIDDSEVKDLIKNLHWMIVGEIDSEEAFAAVIGMRNSIISVALLIAAIVAILSFFIARSISKPIKALSDVAKAVAEGDLTVKLDESTSQDEVGVLNNAFRKMLNNLKTLVSQINEASEQVSSASQQLSGSAQQVSTSSQQVASTVQEMAKGAQQQSLQTEEANKVISEISSSAQQMAANSSNAAEAAVKANKIAQEGVKSGEEGREKINQIKTLVNDSAVSIQELGEKSQQIGNIVKIITGIAEQTNLLALNAAIEAARAGDAGRGFAVVADEVRKLAEESGKAADQISGLIGEVQNSTDQAVTQMNKGSEEVNRGSEVIESALSSLQQITTTVEEVATQVQQISASTQQQASGAEQAVEAVNNVATSAEEQAAGAEEVSAAAEEQSAAMEEISSSSEELSAMAEELRANVAQFKVDESSTLDVEKHEAPVETKLTSKRQVFKKHDQETHVKLKEAQERLKKMRDERVRLQQQAKLKSKQKEPEEELEEEPEETKPKRTKKGE